MNRSLVVLGLCALALVITLLRWRGGDPESEIRETSRRPDTARAIARKTRPAKVADSATAPEHSEANRDPAVHGEASPVEGTTRVSLRVLDPDGRPAPNVEVAIWRPSHHHRAGRFSSGMRGEPLLHWRGRTDKSGLAVYEGSLESGPSWFFGVYHYPNIGRPFLMRSAFGPGRNLATPEGITSSLPGGFPNRSIGGSSGLSDVAVCAAALLPKFEFEIGNEPALRRELGVGEIPETPIELILPPSGRVRLEFLEDGRPTDEELVVWFDLLEPSESRRAVSPDAKHEGMTGIRCRSELVVPFIPLGFSLPVLIAAADGSREHTSVLLPGPIEVGSEVVHRLELGGLSTRPRIRARLLRDDGEPWANTEVEVRVNRVKAFSRGAEAWRLRTDDVGGLRFYASDPTELAVEFAVESQGKDSFETTLNLPVDRGLDHDLGEVIVGALVELVRGRLVDDEGAGVGGIDLELGRHENIDLDPEHGLMSRSRTEADGRFRMKGPRCLAPLHLFVDRHGALARRMTFSAGDDLGNIVVGDRPGRLQGRVVARGPKPPAKILVGIRYADGNPFRQGRELKPGEAFEFASLPSGRARLLVSTGAGSPCATVEGIEIHAGKAALDSRLSPFVIEDWFARYSVVVVGIENEPLPRAELKFIDRVTGKSIGTVWTKPDGKRTTFLPRGISTDLVISAGGFKPKRLSVSGGEELIRLDR